MVFKEELQCYSVFLRNQVFCLKPLTICRTSNYDTREYFFLKYSTSVLLTNAFKTAFVVSYFILVIELFPNIKRPGFYTLTGTFFLTFLLIILRIINVFKILHKNVQLYITWSSAKTSFFQTIELIFWK